MEQQQEVQLDEGISLVDVFRLLLSHLKMLILAVLIGCVLGSSFAVFKTYGVYHYSTSVTFYVNPKKADVVGDNTNINGTYSAPIMDSMIKLLNDEIFAEALILNDKELPEKNVWTTAAEEEKLDLNAKIDAAQVLLDDLKEKETEIENLTEEKAEALTSLTKANKDLTKANKALDEALALVEEEWEAHYKKYSYLNETESNPFSIEFNSQIYVSISASHPDKISETLRTRYGDWKEKSDDQKAADEAHELAEQTVDDLTDTITEKEKLLEKAQESTNDEINVALNAWRETESYKQAIAKYKKAVSFQYLLSTEDLSDSQYLSRNQIFVNLSVYSHKEEQKAFAEDLLERVKVVVPSFVEKNMTKINGYTGTNCIRTSRLDEVEHDNADYMLTSIIKYGLLAGVAALILVCIAIVLLDKSDKRLRDTEVIVKKFNLPVLGIIPCIEEVEQAQKKKTDKSYTEVE